MTGAWVVVPAEWLMIAMGPITGYLSRRAGKGPFLTGGAIIEGLGLLPLEHVGRMFGISPILATGVGGSIGGAVFGAFLSSNTLPPVHGAPPGPPLPSIHAFEGFWALAAGLSLLGACFAAVYLVTYWSGFRGGDRAMVARPLIEGAAPAASASASAPADPPSA